MCSFLSKCCGIFLIVFQLVFVGFCKNVYECFARKQIFGPDVRGRRSKDPIKYDYFVVSFEA